MVNASRQPFLFYGIAAVLTILVTLGIRIGFNLNMAKEAVLYGALLLSAVPFAMGLFFEHDSWWLFSLLFVLFRTAFDLAATVALRGWNMTGGTFAFYLASTLVFGYVVAVASCYLGVAIRIGIVKWMPHD